MESKLAELDLESQIEELRTPRSPNKPPSRWIAHDKKKHSEQRYSSKTHKRRKTQYAKRRKINETTL